MDEGRLRAAVTPVLGAGRLSVAVWAPGRAAPTGFGGGAFAAASVVKTGILAALLLSAQDAGRPLAPARRRRAAAMIERSDNAAATALWAEVGHARGFGAALRRLGLRETVPDAAERWGLTHTTALDQARLLRAVFTGASGRPYGDPCGPPLLSPRSRAVLRHRLGRVVPEQRWGVSAASDPGSPVALKNGWLPRDPTGRWVVNSAGRVVVDGRALLLVVLSDGHASRAAGVAAVERAARAAAGAFSAAADAPAAAAAPEGSVGRGR
ncbi:serine hydrolase [Streptomyces sp. AJS327]|uniref:serine hydrolase n=1 Tax=Streptomyces sp. AJS327 TaxID=2545265 RepID=UPI0027E4A1D4|nr:serine hydrolase [Streptomyces sp. AJS327]